MYVFKSATDFGSVNVSIELVNAGKITVTAGRKQCKSKSISSVSLDRTARMLLSLSLCNDYQTMPSPQY